MPVGALGFSPAGAESVQFHSRLSLQEGGNRSDFSEEGVALIFSSTCAYSSFCFTCLRLKACFILETWRLYLAPNVLRYIIRIFTWPLRTVFTSKPKEIFMFTLCLFRDFLWTPASAFFVAHSNSTDPVCFAQPGNSSIFYTHAISVQRIRHTDFNIKVSQIKILPWTQALRTLASLLVFLSASLFLSGMAKARTYQARECK